MTPILSKMIFILGVVVLKVHTYDLDVAVKSNRL